MMKKGLQVGVDVDLTFVDIGNPWFEWLKNIYGEPSPGSMEADMINKGAVSYNLSDYFRKPKLHEIKPYEFFEDPHLYDKVKPLPFAVDTLFNIIKLGGNVHIISHCKKGSFSSKVRMIERYTQDFMSLDPKSGNGFYATKNKGMINVDVMIDDRHDMLNQFDDKVIKILFKTPYTQEEPLRTKPDLTTDSWLDIAKFLKDL